MECEQKLINTFAVSKQFNVEVERKKTDDNKELLLCYIFNKETFDKQFICSLTEDDVHNKNLETPFGYVADIHAVASYTWKLFYENS